MFITFEGPEGAGKTTQARILAERLKQWSPVVLTREPGGTPAGDELRRILLATYAGVPAIAEAMIVAASRACLISQVIQPALREGKIVVCDRHCDTTYVIQGYGMGVPLSYLRTICSLVTEGVQPDLTFLLDLPAVDGVQRKMQQPDEFGPMDERALALGELYRKGYQELMLIDPHRWRVIAATQYIDVIALQIYWHTITHQQFIFNLFAA